MTQELIVLRVITTLRIFSDRGYLIRLLTAAARNLAYCVNLIKLHWYIDLHKTSHAFPQFN